MLITEVLNKYRIKYTTQHKDVRQGWVGISCPWCGGASHKMHLGINLASGAGSCWQCGPKRLVDILVKLAGIPAGEAAAVLNEVPRARVAQRPQGRFTPLPGVGPLHAAHRAYLQGRGLDPDALVRLWGIGGTQHQPRLGWSLYIPVHAGGEIVSWLTRSIGNGQRRYVAAKPEEEAVPHKSLIYGADYCRGAVVVVEGAVDVWAGGPGFGSVLGLSFSQDQVNALAAIPRRAICFDVEESGAAQRRASRLASALAVYPGTTDVIKLETGKDVATADRAEVAEIRRAFLE